MDQQELVKTVNRYLQGDGITSNPDEVFHAIMALTEEGLRRYDYGFYQLNLLSVYGNSFSVKAINALAETCTRARLWAIWLNARHFSGIDNEGRAAMEGWDPSIIEKALADGNGLIICTPHVGAYRMLPADLSLMGFDATMAIDTKSAGCYSQLIRAGQVSAERQPSVHGRNGLLTICDVERESNSTLILARILQRNGIVIFWFDGNLGLDGRLGSGNRCVTTFLHRTVAVKSGFARLAAATGAPILPVYIPYSSSFRGTLHWGTPQYLHGTDSARRAAAAVEYTAELYRQLEEYVLRYPEQWESMRFLHRWRSIAKTLRDQHRPMANGVADGAKEREVVFRLPPTRVMCLPADDRVTLVDVETLSVIQMSRHAEAFLNQLCTDEGLRVHHGSSDFGDMGRHSQHSELLTRLGAIGMLEAQYPE